MYSHVCDLCTDFVCMMLVMVAVVLPSEKLMVLLLDVFIMSLCQLCIGYSCQCLYVRCMCVCHICCYVYIDMAVVSMHEVMMCG